MESIPSDPVRLSESVRHTLAACHCVQDQLLPVLHAIQDRLGFVPPSEVPAIAEAFNLSRAEVHGVLSFYHHFRSAPPATHVIHICRAEACQSMGGDALLAHAERMTGCRLHDTGTGQRFELTPVYCLGQCATAPALMIDQTLFGRVTPARFDQLLDNLQEAP